MNNINLSTNPFYLKDEDIKWVKDTFAGMTLKDKVGQLFCLLGDVDDDKLMSTLKKVKPAGLMFRPSEAKKLINMNKHIQAEADIPLFIAANLEEGGSGVVQGGTLFGSQMQVAATDNIEMAYGLGLVAGREGKAVGCNLSFAPVVDLDLNFRNPITNTRTYGSDVERVTKMALSYIKGVQEAGLAVSIKHFPGDGVDDRDQHVLASVNSLSCEEWDNTYGEIYQQLIDNGARTMMVGHIMQPAYSKALRPELADESIMPATLSEELLGDLLRERLGFNGLIITDATTMTGFNIAGKRNDIVPRTIEAGCDLFLFNKSIEEDYQYMLRGIENGILSISRVDEAVTRILAVKASLGIHKKENTTLPGVEVIGCEEHNLWAKGCADEAITLVKDSDHLLPLNADQNKRVLLIPLGEDEELRSSITHFKELMNKQGFIVSLFEADKEKRRDLLQPVESFTENYDIAVYLAHYKSASNKTELKIHWSLPTGIDAPWFAAMIPTIFISLANPYHLQDIPRVKTFINAYTNSEFTIEALVRKIVGKSKFKGISPVDPFCGYWDTRL